MDHFRSQSIINLLKVNNKVELKQVSHVLYLIRKQNMKNPCILWASTRENLSLGVYEQQRRRPACALAKSDQRLCYSLIVKYHI